MRSKLIVIKAILIGIPAVFASGYLLYDSIWVMVLTPIVIYVIYRVLSRREKQKRKEEISRDFEIVMQSVAGDLKAGLSMDNAWREAVKALRNNRKKEDKAGELERLMEETVRSMQMNEPLEALLPVLAKDTEDEDIDNFAEVYSFAKRSGGNLAAIVEKTAFMMRDRRETEQDIQVMVASKKLEQRVMNAMPIFILAFLRLSSPDYLSVLYHNLFGQTVMTICAAFYVGIIYGSNRILKIEV